MTSYKQEALALMNDMQVRFEDNSIRGQSVNFELSLPEPRKFKLSGMSTMKVQIDGGNKLEGWNQVRKALKEGLLED